MLVTVEIVASINSAACHLHQARTMQHPVETCKLSKSAILRGMRFHYPLLPILLATLESPKLYHLLPLVHQHTQSIRHEPLLIVQHLTPEGASFKSTCLYIVILNELCSLDLLVISKCLKIK